MGKIALRRISAVRLSRAEIAQTAACAVTLTLWNTAACGGFALGALAVFVLLCLACVLAGRICVRGLGPDALADFPTVFLFGFLALNLALYLLAWVSPLSIVANALFLLAGVLVLQVLWPPPPLPLGDGPRFATAQLALAICLIAATFWSQDAIVSRVAFRDGVLFKSWTDAHFHASEIRLFRDARGFATLEDLRMAGQPVWFYHHASYVVPGLVSAATGTPAYVAFGCVLVPLGAVLSGLAAYALIRSLWGGEAGLAALAALLLLPDASWHGLADAVLGYHWLQQIGPAGLYGVAAMAAAWLLMFAGCRSGRLGLVAFGLLTAAMVVHFKAHVFVAGALLIWLYPGVCLRGVRWRWKCAWLVFATAVFVAVATEAQRIEAVPTLRIDGSALKNYMSRTVVHCYYAATRSRFDDVFSAKSSLAIAAYWGTIFLFYGTLGLFGVANLALLAAVIVRKVLGRASRFELEYAVFPILITINYLVMALGLAYDRRSPGHPEELMHRPFVWAYFISAAWAGGLGYRLVLDARVRRDPRLRTVLAAALFVLLLVPYRLGPGVQVGPSWGHLLTNKSYPRGLFECARYVRESAAPGEIVQESANDPIFVFGAECEHPAYAIAYFDSRKDRVLTARVAELETLKRLTDRDKIRQFARDRGIRWYVLRPESRVYWPASMLARPDFAWNGFRVFSFR